MYLFKEFNRIHAQRVRASMILYFVMFFIFWSATSFFFENLTTALTITLLLLLVTHLVRIERLAKLRKTSFTALQYVVTVCMALVIALLVIFAYSQVAMSGLGFSWGTFKSVLLSVGLAVFLSVYVDFAIASFLQRSRPK
jgi:hypothetical protein